jgi:Tfp pilus assembly protein FimT
MKYPRTAFSFVELIIIVVFLGIFTVIAVPRFNYALISKQKAEITARKIVTDLRLTRRLAISDAATNDEGYGLVMVGSDPYTGYEIQNEVGNATLYSHTINSSVLCTGGKQFIFGPLGSPKAESDTQLTISAEGNTYTINIVPATGTIKCVEN